MSDPPTPQAAKAYAPGVTFGPWVEDPIVRFRLRYHEGEVDALEYEHECGIRGRREDAIPLQPAWSNGWRVESFDPLSLSPSLLCTSCGLHGFVRGGAWCPC